MYQQFATTFVATLLPLTSFIFVSCQQVNNNNYLPPPPPPQPFPFPSAANDAIRNNPFNPIHDNSNLNHQNQQNYQNTNNFVPNNNNNFNGGAVANPNNLNANFNSQPVVNNNQPAAGQNRQTNNPSITVIEDGPLLPELEANLEEILATATAPQSASPFNFALPSMRAPVQSRFPSPARVIERIRMASAASAYNNMPVMITIPPHVLRDTVPASQAIVLPDEGCASCGRGNGRGRFRSPGRFRNRRPFGGRGKFNPGSGGTKGGSGGGYSNSVGGKGGFQPVNRPLPPPPAQSLKGGGGGYQNYQQQQQQQLRLDSKKIVVVVLQVNPNDQVGFGGRGGTGGFEQTKINQYRREDYVGEGQQQQMMYASPIDNDIFLDIIENINNQNANLERRDASPFVGMIAQPSTTSTTTTTHRPSSSHSPVHSMPFHVENSDREIITQEKEDESSYASA